jgi:hypothetical protein
MEAEEEGAFTLSPLLHKPQRCGAQSDRRRKLNAILEFLLRLSAADGAQLLRAHAADERVRSQNAACCFSSTGQPFTSSRTEYHIF